MLTALLLACHPDGAIAPTPTCHPDLDGDGFGDADGTVPCSDGVADASDCDDGDPRISPARAERCANGVDDDCSGGDEACMAPAGTMELGAQPVHFIGPDKDSNAGSAVSLDDDCVADASGGLTIWGDVERDYNVQGSLAYALSGDQLDGEILPARGRTLSTPEKTSWWFGVGRRACLSNPRGGERYVVLPTGNYEGQGILAVGFKAPLTADRTADDPDLEIVDSYGYVSGGTVDAGDVDGDGESELIIGRIDNSSPFLPGQLYVLDWETTASWDVTNARATFYVVDQLYTRIGSHDCVGDLDGDGLADILLGLPSWYYVYETPPVVLNNGGVFLFHGPVEGSLLVGDQDGGLGDADTRWDGERFDDMLGDEISCTQDFDGDGRLDLTMSAPGWNADESEDLEAAMNGSVYVLNDETSGLRSPTDATWVLRGTTDDSSIGGTMSTDSDVDGDGRGDLVLGLHGEARIYYGGAWAGVSDTSTPADATLLTPDPSTYPYVAHGRADLNGDGFDDLALSTPETSSWAAQNGSITVVFGGDRR